MKKRSNVGKSSKSRKTKGVRELCNLKSNINYEKCIKNKGKEEILDDL